MEKHTNQFIATRDRYVGYSTYDNAGEKVGKVEEQWQLLEVSELEERIGDALVFAHGKETTTEFERQVRGFFDPASDGVVEVPSASWLVPFLLLVLQERDSSGNELVWGMRDFDFGLRNPAVVHRSLQQMEEEGLVVSEHEWSDGRLSWRYSIREPGEAYLEFWANSLARYREEVDFFLHLYNE